MKQKLCSMKEKKARERSRSTRRMDELWRKKRGKVKEEGEREKRVFKETKKTPRSPVERRRKKIRVVIKEWRKEIKVLEKMRGLKGVRGEIIKFGPGRNGSP